MDWDWWMTREVWVLPHIDGLPPYLYLPRIVALLLPTAILMFAGAFAVWSWQRWKKTKIHVWDD